MNECVCYGEPHGVECDYCIAKTTLDRFGSLASVFRLALDVQEHCDSQVALYLSLVSLTPPKVLIVPCDTAAHAVIEVGGKRYRATKCTDDGVSFLAWRDADEIKDGAP